MFLLIEMLKFTVLWRREDISERGDCDGFEGGGWGVVRVVLEGGEGDYGETGCIRDGTLKI